VVINHLEDVRIYIPYLYTPNSALVVSFIPADYISFLRFTQN